MQYISPYSVIPNIKLIDQRLDSSGSKYQILVFLTWKCMSLLAYIILIRPKYFHLLRAGKVAPTELNLAFLYKDGDVYAFNATWEPSPPEIETYNICVSSLPPQGLPATLLSNGSTGNIYITEGVFYDVTLSTCPYQMSSSSFTIGGKFKWLTLFY